MSILKEFLVSIGFQADNATLKSALAKVTAFGVGVKAISAAIYAGLTQAAKGEVELAQKAKELRISSDTLSQLGYVAEQTGSSFATVVSAMDSLYSRFPRLKNGEEALLRMGKSMRGLSEQGQILYAKRMGIDPKLIPMLTQDISELKAEYAQMQSVMQTSTSENVQNSRLFLAEMGKLKTMAHTLMKALSMAFMGEGAKNILYFRKIMQENLGKIKAFLESLIKLILRISGAITQFVSRIIQVFNAVYNWFSKLTTAEKNLAAGIFIVLTAWKALNKGFLASPLGLIISAIIALVLLLDNMFTSLEGGQSLFDWTPYKESIKGVISVFEVLGTIISAMFSGLANSAPNFVNSVLDVLLFLSRTIENIAKLFWAVFSGDFSGALDIAKDILTDYIDTFYKAWDNFTQGIINFFSSAFNSITAMYPDFGAWAKDSATKIVNFFKAPLDWIKQKLLSLVDWMPDWVKEQLGITANIEVDEPDFDMPEFDPKPSPSLIPSPSTQNQLTTNNQKNTTINAQTDIHINSADPQTTANLVAQKQEHVYDSMTRNTAGVF